VCVFPLRQRSTPPTINRRITQDGATPACIAAKLGRVKVLATLGALDADLGIIFIR